MASPKRNNDSPLRGAGQRPRPASAASDSAMSSEPLGTPQRFPFPPQPPNREGLYPITSRPNLNPRESAIRLRRLPSNLAQRLEPIPSIRQQEQQQIQEAQYAQALEQQQRESDWQANRRRSSSEPQRPNFEPSELMRTRTTVNNMPSVPELSQTASNTQATNFEPARPPIAGPGRFRRASTAALNGMKFHRNADGTAQPVGIPAENVYDSRVVDLLDVIDPEVSALQSLTNIQNSLFVPQLGRFVNRRPTYDLSRLPAFPQKQQAPPEANKSENDIGATAMPPKPLRHMPTEPDLRPESAGSPGSERAFSITSALSESRYAVLPHGISLEGWSDDDKAELNDHVRHMMHSRRSKFKRSLRGFGKYVSRPLGFLVTLYATLITLFGLAWVLFLIGWISIGSRQPYIINVIDNVLVALFAIVGDGLAPFRIVDTYHMAFIAHYHHLTWKLRKKMKLPKLENKNDLPTEPEPDLEASRHEEEELSVLTPEQQAKLMHHQDKFSKSHTFYKPHETDTHFAFPLRLLVAIVVLLDCHSCLQIALGACTWGIYYKVRPQALTAVILCCSITVNITAGILISVGDRRTRKKDVIERMVRQELTEEAMNKIKKRHEKHEERLKQLEEAGEDDDSSDKEKKGRMSLDFFRRSEDKGRMSEDRGRRSEDRPRRSFDVFRKTDEKPRRSLNLSRRISEADSRNENEMDDLTITTAANENRQ